MLAAVEVGARGQEAAERRAAARSEMVAAVDADGAAAQDGTTSAADETKARIAIASPLPRQELS